MASASGEQDDVHTLGKKTWGSARWGAVVNLLGAIDGIYGEEEYVDLTIVYGNTTFKVHKAVICPRSDFFRAACKANTFKSRALQEGKESVINITDDGGPEDDKTFGIMVEFLYRLDYDVDTLLLDHPSTHASPTDETASTHARVFAVADKYGIRSLRRSACAKFVEYLRAYRASAHDLAEAIHVVHNFVRGSSGEHHQLRDRLQEAICDSHQRILGEPELRDAVQSVDGLAFNLFLAQKTRINGFPMDSPR